MQQCSDVFYADFPQTCAATALCRPRDHIFQAAPVTPSTTTSQLHNSLHNFTTPSTTARLLAQLHNFLHNFTTPSTTSQLPPQSGLFCTTALLLHFKLHWPYHTELYSAALVPALHCTTLQYIALHNASLHCLAMHLALSCSANHITALHCTIQYDALPCTAKYAGDRLSPTGSFWF